MKLIIISLSLDFGPSSASKQEELTHFVDPNRYPQQVDFVIVAFSDFNRKTRAKNNCVEKEVQYWTLKALFWQKGQDD